MALTKPILNTVPAWDRALGQTFTFNVVGGDQVVGSILYISNNATGTLVYSKTITSYKYEITVPANAFGLSNGTYYNAYVVTRDSNGNTSAPSNTIQFYCYSTPAWGFSNIAQGGIVNNSTFVPEVVYNQTQGELLNSYSIILYNAFQTEIASSGIRYVSEDILPISVEYVFNGLEDNTVYYVRAIGQTVNGTSVDSGYIRFTVQYTAPSAYSQFFLTNNCNAGYITYTSNTMLIVGESNPSPPTYIDDTKVDLTSDGSWVEWSNGFSVSGDFTLKAWLNSPKDNVNLITLTGVNGEFMRIGYYEDQEDSTKVYADVLVDEKYYIYTPSIIKPLTSEQLCLQLRRINNIYEIKLEVV